jgi:hypothetical protein
MDFTQLYNMMMEDFELKDLPEEEKEAMFFEISKTIQKQFLINVYDILGAEQFDALQASASMGEEFYGTTLKHLLPNYEDVFQASRQKIVDGFKAARNQ